MKLHKILTVALSAVIIIGVTGCSQRDTNNGKIKVSVGSWPTEASPEILEKNNKFKADFELENPNIEIVPDNYSFDIKTFMVKASGKQLPNLYTTVFTQTKQIIKEGYAADITDALNELGWTEKINKSVMDYISDDGRIYAVPKYIYAQGLYINKAIFKEAGLVNADGSIIVPETFEQLVEYAGIIKEKTGRAGYVIPTIDNAGGWHFMNWAWNYGVDFEEVVDGKWKATFDTQEARDALQLIKDLKWKYNALPEMSAVNAVEAMKLFGTGQAAMLFGVVPEQSFPITYGMKIEDICVVAMPEGPNGKNALMGGDVYMFSAETTPEQIKAGLQWLDFVGAGPTIAETSLSALQKNIETTLGNGGIVIDRDPFPVWSSEDYAKRNEIYKNNTNVDLKDFENYLNMENVTVKAEESVCAQELYATLDKCIQEVITNKDADVAKLINNANQEFQVNYLDKQ